MSKLTTQLQQARQEIAEKEAESKNWEERVAGLSQQLKEASSMIEVSFQMLVLEQLHVASSQYTHTIVGVRATETSCERAHHSARPSKTRDHRERG